MTYILVAGVDKTVWTQSCPLSVLCYFGGNIYPRISSVWWSSYYLWFFLECPGFPEELTSTGVEYLTNEPCYPIILYNFLTYLYVKLKLNNHQ